MVVGRVVVVVAPGHGCQVSHSYCWIVTDKGSESRSRFVIDGLGIGTLGEVDRQLRTSWSKPKTRTQHG